MPYYEYECEDCGVFGCRAPMDAFANPADCPTCGKISPRVLNSVPFVSTVSSNLRKAHEVNERSADNPKRLSTHGPMGNQVPIRNRQMVQASNDSKAFPAKRPWMLSQ